jgi:hypothetical protein
MNFISAEFITRATQLMRSVALAVHQTVVVTTPVDTGRARSNWFVSFGSPVLTDNEPPGGDSVSARGRQAADQAFSQGRPVIASWRLGSGDIYVSNGVPYIGELDRGSSRQAPKGMSRQAILAGRRVLKETKLLPPGTG